MRVIVSFVILFVGAAAEDCTLKDSTYKVYYDWPFTLDCVSVIDDYEYDIEQYDNFTCVITEVDTGRTLLNTSFGGSLYYYDYEDIFYRINVINRTTPTKYKAQLQSGSSCWIESMTLEPIEFPVESCEKNLQNTLTHNVTVTLGAAFEGKCDVPADADIPKTLVHDSGVGSPENPKIYWLYNCKDRLPDNTRTEETSLYFTNVSYESNPGVYTCVVEYNNMTRYRIHHRMCVKQRVSWPMSIKCVSQSATIGDDVEIECNVDAGVGLESKLLFSSRFNKLNATGDIDQKEENISCISYVGAQVPTRNERFSCQLYQNRTNEPKCFYRPPTTEEIKAQVTTLKMVYRIKKVQMSDFGIYLATIKRSSSNESANFSLTFNREPGLAMWHTPLAVCLSAVGGVALFSLLTWILCEVELRWVWFRTFAKTEKESKKYCTYLAYYYSKEMSHTHPPQLEAFVMNLNTRLKNIGGDVFDKCRDPGTEQYKAESIFEKLSECHRVVIVLTPEYINDHWSVYEAYEAWKNVIEHGIKIIFIVFPNTLPAVKNLPDEPRTALMKALKRHKVIQWDGTLPFTRRMRIQLELLMPKLPRRNGIEMKESSNEQDELVQTKDNRYEQVPQRKDTNANIYVETENAV